MHDQDVVFVKVDRVAKVEAMQPGLVQRVVDLAIEQMRHATPLSVGQAALFVTGKRGLTPSTALRLAKFFDMSPGFWLNLQMVHDLHLLLFHI